MNRDVSREAADQSVPGVDRSDLPARSVPGEAPAANRIWGILLLLIVGGALLFLTESREAVSETSNVLGLPETSGLANQDSRLLHALGGPVDTVERFIVGFNYGQSEMDAAMFGCSRNEEIAETLYVDCAVVFDSNSSTDPETDRMVREVTFVITGGRVAEISVEPSVPPAPDEAALESLLAGWIARSHGSSS